MPYVINEIIDQFRCTLCHEYLYKPVRKCRRVLHAFCPPCFARLDYCIDCDSEMSHRRFKSIERIIANHFFPCKYHTIGCRFVGKGYIIKKHEDNCHRTIQQCPLQYYNECNWSGLYKNVVEHCRIVHPMNFYETNRKTLKCSKFRRDNCVGCIYYIVLYAYDELFRLTWHVNYVSGLVKWQVFFIGVKKETNRFSYEISFDKLLNNDKLCIKAPCRTLLDSHEDLELNKCVIISYNLLKEYCFDDDLCYTISIIDNRMVPMVPDLDLEC